MLDSDVSSIYNFIGKKTTKGFFLVGLVWEGGTDLQNAIKDKHKSGRPTITQVLSPWNLRVWPQWNPPMIKEIFVEVNEGTFLCLFSILHGGNFLAFLASRIWSCNIVDSIFVVFLSIIWLFVSFIVNSFNKWIFYLIILEQIEIEIDWVIIIA